MIGFGLLELANKVIRYGIYIIPDSVKLWDDDDALNGFPLLAVCGFLGVELAWGDLALGDLLVGVVVWGDLAHGDFLVGVVAQGDLAHSLTLFALCQGDLVGLALDPKV